MTRVLAVEDSRTQAELLRSDLEMEGFSVHVVANGYEALRALSEERFDLVLSDVVMSGMGGYELCRELKNDPRTRQIPVVLLTSLTEPLDVVRGLEAGADNFLRKPYHRDQLVARLKSMLHNKTARQHSKEPDSVRLSLLGRDLHITAERQQILDLLVSTFEELVVTSREVQAREEELSIAHDSLAQQLHSVELERKRLQAVVNAVPVPLFVTSSDGVVSHASESLTELLGTRHDELLDGRLDAVARFLDMDGRPIESEQLPHHRAIVDRTPASSGWAFDVCLDRPDGTQPPVMFHASPILKENGVPAGCVGTLQILGPLGRHDSLTGLPNHVAFLDHAARLPLSQRAGTAVVLVELDRFEAVRAAIGNDDSADIVGAVARRLRHVLASSGLSPGPDDHFLAYMEGVRFGIILVNLPDAMAALRVAEEARRSISEYGESETPVRLTASVGVSVGDANLDIAKLLAAAQAALHRAGDAGGDAVEMLGPDATQNEMDRLRLEMDLRAAVATNDISLMYQPEFDLATGDLLGFEALARWRHPTRGPIPPDVFIGLAEDGGLILELGRQVLLKACAQAQLWATISDRSLSISVNVSAVQLRPEFYDEVVDVLERTGLAPAKLVLEVTETAAMGDPETTLPVLARLRSRGIRIALDDFGTGYSSMAYLTRIHFDQLKLDRSFVTGLGQAGADAIVAQSIVALGQSLGVPVLAEGVENLVQVQALKELRCDQVQGYLYARPLEEPAVVHFIEQTPLTHPPND